MMNDEQFDNLLIRVKEITGGAGARDEKLMAICRVLHDKVDHYHWVGFYLVGEDRKELLLGPYLGDPTQHIRIPFGQGVCGLAAEKQRTLMVPDVSRLLNYLSCSPEVKSEMVVPIFQNEKMVAQLDIDSHIVDAFGESDRKFLEDVAGVVGGVF
jgi:L-methionine (R)-S-oxide reductase